MIPVHRRWIPQHNRDPLPIYSEEKSREAPSRDDAGRENGHNTMPEELITIPEELVWTT